jgi:hypothetical protein
MNGTGFLLFNVCHFKSGKKPSLMGFKFEKKYALPLSLSVHQNLE